jgi:hypothetical protein
MGQLYVRPLNVWITLHFFNNTERNNPYDLLQMKHEICESCTFIKFVFPIK